MQTLFANTGVQLICIPLGSGRRYTTAQIGYGWQYCQLENPKRLEDPEAPPLPLPYVQWQIIQGNVSRLLLAVDTSLGDPEVGYFCDATALAGDFQVKLAGLLDLKGEPLPGIPKIDLRLRAATATAGEAKPVHMVVDFGNSRTGALLLEVVGEVTQNAQMTPFELVNRYHLDLFDEAGDPVSHPAARWFSSKTRWCNSPYRPAQETMKKEYVREQKSGLLGKKTVTKEREVKVRPPLFNDLSMARLGREVDDVSQAMHAEGDFRTGVSTPKRYLWADDESWLEGAFWYMADPHDRCGTGTFAAKLQGPLLKFLHEDDRDFLLDEDKESTEESFAPEVPIKPRHAPRTMMVTALYEMLCQAYSYVNSLAYRTATGDPSRTREIRSLTLTYPSGMFQPERERFQKQAQKAINIFAQTLGQQQRAKPSLTLSLDEASAVHLTYIWSELKMLGQDPRLWFSTLSQVHSHAMPGQAAIDPEQQGDATGLVPAGRRRNRGRIRRPGGLEGGQASTIEPDTNRQELRIACIDIGGGTTDLMIARYNYEPGMDDAIYGQTLHVDGIPVAGDQLVKRLLEKVIVPAFADAIGLEEEDVQLLFGPEVPKNRGFGSQRVNWINRLLVPLAEAYLSRAVDDDSEEPVTHTDPEVVDPAALESLDLVCTKLRGPGYYNFQQPLSLRFQKEAFEDVVHEVFDDLLFDFCSRAVDHQVDVVLLAGQPTKLGFLQEMVRMYLPLPASRIIPMYNHYAGNWYPYQDTKGHAPGLIVDPKSAVVVGAAIEFLARNGMLPQFKFHMRGKQTENTYYWGVMTESTSTIRDDRVLFHPVDENTRDEWTEFTTSAQRVILGRKMAPDEDARTSPIYVLKTAVADRIGPTEMTIRLRRVRATEEVEEHLQIESVSGAVAGEPAVLGENVVFKWRTLGDERYYLDTGGLDNIELPK